MNWLDVVILAVFAFFAVKGMINGLIREGANLAGAVLGILVAYHRSGALAGWLTIQTGLSISISRVVAFVGQALIIAAIVSLVGAVAGKLVRTTPVGWLDSGGGLVLGGVKAFLVVCVLLTALVALPLADSLSVLDESLFGDRFLAYVPSIASALEKVFGGELPEGWVPWPRRGSSGEALL